MSSTTRQSAAALIAQSIISGQPYHLQLFKLAVKAYRVRVEAFNGWDLEEMHVATQGEKDVMGQLQAIL